jgi:hypothetical protein
MLKAKKTHQDYVFTLVSKEGLERINRGNRREIERRIAQGESIMIILKVLTPHVDTIINILKAFIHAGNKELGLKYLDEAIHMGHWTITETRTGSDLGDAIVAENTYAMYGQRVN